MNVKDALVKNGAWDITGAERTFYDQLDKMNDDGYSNDIDRAKGTKTSAEVKAEASKFIQQYLGVELEDKNAQPAVPEYIVCQVCRQHAARIKSMSRHWPSTL